MTKHDTEKLTEAQRQLLAPHATFYRAMLAWIYKADDAALVEMAEACAACSQTNCGWDAYGVAQMFIPEIRGEQISRLAALSSASTGKGQGHE